MLLLRIRMQEQGEERMHNLSAMRIALTGFLALHLGLDVLSAATRVACIGDSVTAGPQAPDARHEAYPVQLQALLGHKWQIRNFGNVGATVIRTGKPTIWESLGPVKGFAPDYVIIILGTEDTHGPPRDNWSGIESFEQDYRDLIREFKGLPEGPQVIICSPTAMVLETAGLSEARRAELAVRKQRIQEIRHKIRRVAAAQRAHYADLNTLLQGRPELMRKEDGVHPNERGYARIAEYMASVLRRLVSGETTSRPEKQYKKRTRDLVTAMRQGELTKADQTIAGMLAEQPNDPELHFHRAIARSLLKKPEDSLDALRQSLALGLPFERYLAGPRSLMRELYGQLGFWSVAKSYNLRLIHGPVLGNVTHRSASFWFRTSVEDRVAVSVRAMDSERPVALGMTRTTEDSDFTGIVTVSGLKPDTPYRYQVLVSDRRVFGDKLPEFRTAPLPAARSSFSVAFGGGAGYTPWKERMWNTIRAQTPRALLLLGDNVYIDTPTVPATQRYCYYRRQSRPEYKRLAAGTPVYAIWDDHDFGDNDCTSSLDPRVPEWKPAVLNVFKQNWVNPYYGAGRQAPGVWFDFSIGDVDFLLLDCRYYRQNPDKTQNPTMLGPVQKVWLKQKLGYSRATFKVICSSVPWAQGTKPGSKDTWDGFPQEREEILSFIRTRRIDGVLLLSADRHRSDVRKIERPGAYPLYDFTSSRLTNVHVHNLIPGALFAYNDKCSFGLLEFDTTKPDPEVTLRIVSIDGERVHSMTLKRSELSFPAR